MFMFYSKMNYFEQYENSDAYVPTILKLKWVSVCKCSKGTMCFSNLDAKAHKYDTHTYPRRIISK